MDAAVSGATYRIELEHTPGDVYRWYAKVYWITDDFVPVYTKHGDVAEAVVSACRAWIAEQNVKRQTEVLFVDDDGQDADAPTR